MLMQLQFSQHMEFVIESSVAPWVKLGLAETHAVALERGGGVLLLI